MLEFVRLFWSSKKGATAIVVAVTLPVLVTSAAFGTEAAFWTYRHRLVQQQADAAAYAGTLELMEGDENGIDVTGAIEESLAINGFRGDIGTYVAEWPPKSGAYAGKKAVRVSVSEKWPRMFTALFLSSDVDIGAGGTASPEELGEACMLALDPSGSGTVNITGTADVTLKGCSVVANSTSGSAFTQSGSSNLSAACAGAVGGVSATTSGMDLTSCSYPRERIPPIKDPYANVPEPTVTGPCKTPNLFDGSPSSTYYITSGRYCGMTVKRTVNLAPGLYIIDGGDLSLTSTSKLNGSGVTFFLTIGARLIIDGSADVDISAPTSGTYSGLLFFADRSGPQLTHTFSGSASSQFEGAVYMPNDHLVVAGSNSAAAGCTQFIARTLELTGTSGAGISCDSSGTNGIEFYGRVRLVE